MRFSETEKQHLLKAWLAISLAFAMLMGNIATLEFLLFFVISLLTVGTGFLLHELMHKLVAQRYGCWAEFRADDRMLLFAIISAFAGFIIAAPGAVLIQGHVTVERNGKISAAGPATNLLLSLVFLTLLYFMPQAGMVTYALTYGFRVNAFLGLFNMIPFGFFDGEKIFRWNKKIYFAQVACAGLLVALSYFA